MPYWTFNALGFIGQKIEDMKKYDEAVREAFSVYPDS